MNNATVFIVDDDAAVRDSLALLLGLKNFRTQAFSSASTFLRIYGPDLRGCVLLDVRMPDMSGLDLQIELQQRGSNLPLVIMTAHGDVATARKALKAGAFDFLEKPLDEEVLLEVLQNATNHHATLQKANSTAPAVQRRDLIGRLTPREHDVMRLVADGLQNREIAPRLGISSRTVEVYKARMMEKLGARTIADVVRFALLEPEGNR